MDSITQFRADPFGTFIRNAHARGHLTSEEGALLFGALIINAAQDGDLTEDLAMRWGAHAGHYATLALLERQTAEVATRYFQETLSNVVVAAFGGGR